MLSATFSQSKVVCSLDWLVGCLRVCSLGFCLSVYVYLSVSISPSLCVCLVCTSLCPHCVPKATLDTKQHTVSPLSTCNHASYQNNKWLGAGVLDSWTCGDQRKRGKKKFTCNKNWSSRISCSLAPVLISSQCPYALECSMPLPCSMWFAAVCATDLSTLGLESDKLEKPVTHTHRRRSSQGRVELPVLRPLPKSLNNDMKLVRIYVENNNRILTLHWHEVVICMCHDDEVHFRCISL